MIESRLKSNLYGKNGQSFYNTNEHWTFIIGFFFLCSEKKKNLLTIKWIIICALIYSILSTLNGPKAIFDEWMNEWMKNQNSIINTNWIKTLIERIRN